MTRKMQARINSSRNSINTKEKQEKSKEGRSIKDKGSNWEGSKSKPKTSKIESQKKPDARGVRDAKNQAQQKKEY